MDRVEYNPIWFKLGPAWRSWLARASVFWRFVLVVVIICLVVDWIGFFLGIERVDRLPYTGWLIEIAGVMMVAFGLSKKIHLYGGDSIPTRIGSWFSTCPLFKQNVNIVLGSAKLKLRPGQVTVTTTVGLPPDADIDARIVRLEQMMDSLTDELRDLNKTTRSDIADLKVEISKRLDGISGEITEVKNLSSKAHVGDIGMELAGLGWILVGLALATVPKLVLWIFGPIIGFFEV